MFGLTTLGGCNIQKTVGNDPETKTEISLADFQADPNTPSTESQPVQERIVSNDPNSGQLTTPQLTEPLATTQLPTTKPTVGTGIRSGEDGLEFLDAKVGDISGHPIYVSSFFDPVEDRLKAIGQDTSLGSWRQQAVNIIRNRLDGIIYDELLRAETLASLTPQQRVGLQSFLSDFREKIISQNLGSAQLADRRIYEEQGITLDEALRQQELDTLVGLTLYQEINRRINISWRDIKQRYERDIDKFQPPPTVVLQVIRVLEPEGELVDSITARLNSGEPFAEIAASDVNTFNKDTEGRTETLLEEDFAETKFFGPEPLNEAVWGLSVGNWTGPVSLGNANFWILYADSEQSYTSLYEAQLQIFRELTIERREEERALFLTDLIQRARVSSRDEILLRLLYIAEKKYGPQG